MIQASHKNGIVKSGGMGSCEKHRVVAGELFFVSLYLTHDQFNVLQDAVALKPNCGIRPVEETVIDGCRALLAGNVA